MPPRTGIFGWGIVAPKSPNIDSFALNLQSSSSWLSPFNGFGPDNFLVGTPEFCFSDYREWINMRFTPRRYAQLEQKIAPTSLYAIGAFIQALGQNQGLEEELMRLGTKAHVYIGTGLGNVETIHDASISLQHSQQEWDSFWADPVRNSELAAYLRDSSTGREGVPPNPVESSGKERYAAENRWNHYWASQSPELRTYLQELADIENRAISGDIESGKMNSMREKERLRAKLNEKWGCPDPPWLVTTNVLWNLHNTPAAQVSMLGRITGLSFAPVAACSTFGVSLKLAMKAIQSGDAKAVVVGASDAPPHPLVVGTFYAARVLPAHRQVSLPLTQLQGTHVAGGSVIWIVGDYDHMTNLGFQPLGMEPIGVGVSSDAHHIITPSVEGPMAAIEQAFEEAAATPDDLGTWDLHATATPGDYSEIRTLSKVLPRNVLVTARKGTFGHGMSAGGGWELTAQYLGYQKQRLLPTPMRASQLNTSIAALHDAFVFDNECDWPKGYAGKMSMGIGGINACVISRPWKQ